MRQLKNNYLRMKSITILGLFILLPFAVVLMAQTPTDGKKKNIFETLSVPDSITHASVKVQQDSRLEKLLVVDVDSKPQTVSGFRVQVFSTNVQRTGKSEAFKVEKQILEAFPDVAIYISYISPSWKVRVGDFTSQAQAQSFRNELVEAVPNLRSQMYVVPDQVVVHDKK
jgi:hypothetical protein